MSSNITLQPNQNHNHNLYDNHEPPAVVCCGLSTVDLQLHQCNLPVHLEHITSFSHTTSVAGGSSPQVALSLAALGVSAAALTAVGRDDHAGVLRQLLRAGGVDVSYMLEDVDSPTALAILPLFVDGRRGCFVTLGANLTLTPAAVLASPLLSLLSSPVVSIRNDMGEGEDDRSRSPRVFHFGYPHLMPHFQGSGLETLFAGVRQRLLNAMLTLDVNGAGDDTPVLTAGALRMVAHVHANVEEACAITGLFAPAEAAEHKLSRGDMRALTDWFLSRGAASVSVTCGRGGAFLATTRDPDVRRDARLAHSGLELGAFCYSPALRAAHANVNASGAGDAFTAGVVAQLVKTAGACGTQHLLHSGIASALRRIDPTLAPEPTDIDALVTKALERDHIPSVAAFQDGGVFKGKRTEMH